MLRDTQTDVTPRRLQRLLRENADAIANAIVLEQGKTVAGMNASDNTRRLLVHIRSTDAHGDLLRGLQVVETAIGITSNLIGDKLEGKECASYRNENQKLMPLQSARTWIHTFDAFPYVPPSFFCLISTILRAC